MRIETPVLKDIVKIQTMLKPFVVDGIILDRDEDEIATNIRSYKILLKDEEVIGVGALHIHSKFLGEIRSLAISSEFQRKGLGKNLVN